MDDIEILKAQARDLTRDLQALGAEVQRVTLERAKVIGRLARWMSQHGLAAEIGISQPRVSQIMGAVRSYHEVLAYREERARITGSQGPDGGDRD